MKCPHCLENFFECWFYNKFKDWEWIEDKESVWGMRFCKCPKCEKIIIQLGKISKTCIKPSKNLSNRPQLHPNFYNWVLIRPKAVSRTPLPPEVPPEFANDYNEACLILVDSPKASAALSRRCLQNLLREKAKTTKKNLSDQIQEVIDSKKLPFFLSEDLDAVRNIGNFAAHPIKNKITGEIIEVEPGEADWNLDILEELFNFYFVQPELSKKKRQKLNQKLKKAGKPPIKKA